MIIFTEMTKAELFDIDKAKVDQRHAEMLLTPQQRLLLCLDLMELNTAFSKRPFDPEDESIFWIELPLQDKP